MSSGFIIAKELATIFKVLSHQDRIRIIEALRIKAMDVNSLSKNLGLRSARVSQHPSLMRLHRVVRETRKGRHVFYSLPQLELAHWIADGLQFVESRAAADHEHSQIIQKAKHIWPKS